MMLDPISTSVWLAFCAVVLAVPGLIHARRHRDTLEDYITARNSQNTSATVLTLVATTLGTWILFGPAQAPPPASAN